MMTGEVVITAASKGILQLKAAEGRVAYWCLGPHKVYITSSPSATSVGEFDTRTPLRAAAVPVLPRQRNQALSFSER